MGPSLWLRFGKSLHPAKENPPKSGEDYEEWIETVVMSFCETHAFKDKYLSAVLAGNGGEP